MNKVLAIAITCSILSCTFTHKKENPIYITPSELVIEIIQTGEGQQAKEGQEILIRETTRYRDGTLIFSTDQIGGPLKFRIGAKQVIEGVDTGVRGMKTGEIRKLIVPPAMSKRSEYPDNIHPDSTLVYEIELVRIIEN